MHFSPKLQSMIRRGSRLSHVPADVLPGLFPSQTAVPKPDPDLEVHYPEATPLDRQESHNRYQVLFPCLLYQVPALAFLEVL